jgi:beta-phosphoglucomutase-like phosphatase (HAD superfamily)
MRALVFDLDGVIVNSEPLHLEAFRRALAPFGVALTEEEYYRTYVAYTDREAFERALAGPPEAVALGVAEKQRIFWAMFRDHVQAFPDAMALLGRIPGELPLALATGATGGEADHALRALGIRDRFAALVAAEDCRRGKPDPEPYRLAADRLGVPPQACLAIEDTREGIQAARAAGMVCVGVAHTHPPEALAEAHLVVRSLDEVDLEAVAARFWPDGARRA